MFYDFVEHSRIKRNEKECSLFILFFHNNFTSNCYLSHFQKILTKWLDLTYLGRKFPNNPEKLQKISLIFFQIVLKHLFQTYGIVK